MKLVTAKQLTQEIQLSTRTFTRLRDQGKWELGIHYFRFSKSKILYNLDLIQDWIANQHHLDLHQNAIEAFLGSLPSNRPQRKPKKSG
jgi:Putative excisionase (DUF1233)